MLSDVTKRNWLDGLTLKMSDPKPHSHFRRRARLEGFGRVSDAEITAVSILRWRSKAKRSGVASEIELVVGLVEVAEAGDQLSLIIALEAGAGNDVEDSVGAVAEFGAIAAALDFHVVHIFGIELHSILEATLRCWARGRRQSASWFGGRRGCAVDRE